MSPFIHLLAPPLASEKYDETGFLSLLVHDTQGKCQFYSDIRHLRLQPRRFALDSDFRWQRYYPGDGSLPPLEEAPDVLIPVEDRDQLVVREAEHSGEGNGRTLAVEDIGGAGGGHQHSGVTTDPVTSQAGDGDTGEVLMRHPVQMPLTYPICLYSGKITKIKRLVNDLTLLSAGHF